MISWIGGALSLGAIVFVVLEWWLSRVRVASRRRLAAARIGGVVAPIEARLAAMIARIPAVDIRERLLSRLDDTARRRRLSRIEAQLPHALSLIGSGLASGMSLSHAIAFVASDVPEPLASELGIAADEMRGGAGVVDALVRLAERAPIRGLDTLLVAVELQYTLGGDIVALLDRAMESMRSTEELRERLMVQTAQARLSARIVGALPIALFAVLSLSSREYFVGFFTSPIAFGSLVVALLLEALGTLLVWRAASVAV